MPVVRPTEDVITGCIWNAIPPITVLEMDGIQGKNAMDIITVLYQMFIQPVILTQPAAVVVAFVLTYTEKNAMIRYKNPFFVKPIHHQEHVVVAFGLVQVQQQTAISFNILTLSAQHLIMYGNIVHLFLRLEI